MARKIIGWRMVRPRRALSGLGTRIYYDPLNPIAPPKDYGNGYGIEPWWPSTWSCAPGFAAGAKAGSCIQIPLPGGTIGVTVTPTPTATASGNGAIVPAGAVDRAKQWLQEQSLVAGYPNWGVVAAGVGAFLLLRK